MLISHCSCSLNIKRTVCLSFFFRSLSMSFFLSEESPWCRIPSRSLISPLTLFGVCGIEWVCGLGETFIGSLASSIGSLFAGLATSVPGGWRDNQLFREENVQLAHLQSASVKSRWTEDEMRLFFSGWSQFVDRVEGARRMSENEWTVSANRLSYQLEKWKNERRGKKSVAHGGSKCRW